MVMVASGRVGCAGREWMCQRRSERAEDLHDLPVALATVGTAGVIGISRGLVVGGRRRRGRVEHVPRAADRQAPLPVGQQAEVAGSGV
jgi:hypothetical protein